jgi:serine/threonine protein kinase
MKKTVKRINMENITFEYPFDQGRYSQIWLVTNKLNSTQFVAKKFQKLEIIKKLSKKRLKCELSIFSSLSCDFIPQFKGTSENKNEFIIFMELVQGPNLYYFQKQIQKFTQEQIKFKTSQIVLMLEFLHQKKIVFRDLKPENLILNIDGYLKLVDFGCSKVLESKTSKTYTVCGTPEFLAPEVLLGKGHGFAVDYWSLGILIFEMFHFQNPFFNENPLTFYTKIITGFTKFPTNFPREPKKLIIGLLQREPKKRLGMTEKGVEEIKLDKFFKNVNWELIKSKKAKPPILPQRYKLNKLQPYKISFDDETSNSKNPFLKW